MWKSFKDFHNSTNPNRFLHSNYKSEIVQKSKTWLQEYFSMGTKKKINMNKVRVRTKKYHSTINKTNQQNQKT